MSAGRQRAVVASLSLVLTSAAALRAAAQEELRFEPVSTVVLGTGLVVGTTLSLTVLDPPADCRWCDAGSLDRGLSESLFSARDRTTHETLGDVGVGLAWSASLGVGFAGGYAEAGDASRGARHGAQNALAVTEVLLATHLLTTGAKLVAARRRPSASLGFDSEDVDANTSFFSGHAAQSAAAASSVSTLAFLRGYAWAPAALAGFGAVALVTGLLRVTAGRHWASDVLVGWLVGAAVGVLLPLALHPRLDERAPG